MYRTTSSWLSTFAKLGLAFTGRVLTPENRRSRKARSRPIRFESLEGRYMMAVLPGDYNLNGIVQANDYTVWKSNFGQFGEAVPGDGNGDGIVDAADYTVWRDNLGKTFANVAPDPPKTISAIPTGLTTVEISWESSAFAIDYTVQRRQPDVTDEFSTVGMGIVGTSFSDNSVTDGNIYEYQVLARNNPFSAPSQRASLTAGQSSLTAFRAQQFHDFLNPTNAPIYTPFAKSAVAEMDEESLTRGPGIRVNRDDDNDNGTADLFESGIAIPLENDLIEVRVDRLPGLGDLALSVGVDLAVYYSYDKATPIPLVSSTRTEPLNFINNSVAIFVEWATNGHGTDPLGLIDVATSTLLDVLRFHTFHSVVVALGGEGQVPSDPVPDPNNYGVFRLAIDLYRNEGYDVRMYDEDDVSPIGDGAVLNEIINSINHQFVNEVAMYGYSHGGGSVFDLTTRLVMDVGDGIIFEPFIVTFTSYIDAIENDFVTAEQRRPEPLLSLYHLNQYQQNTGATGGFLNGGPLFDPQPQDDEFDVSNLNLVHKTIDDDLTVLAFVRSKLLQKVTR